MSGVFHRLARVVDRPDEMLSKLCVVVLLWSNVWMILYFGWKQDYSHLRLDA